MKKIRCVNCGKKMAVWILMSSSSKDFHSGFFCDDCVPRGCSCNSEPIDGNFDNPNPDNWEQLKDVQGRLLPCYEWSYEEKGFDPLEEVFSEDELIEVN